MHAAAIANDRFSSRTAARDIVPTQRNSCCVRLQRECRIHGEGSLSEFAAAGINVRCRIGAGCRSAVPRGPRGCDGPRASHIVHRPARRRPAARTHITDFIAAYNYARRLKTLHGLTPFEYICKIWTNETERFNVDPTHHTPGLNT